VEGVLDDFTENIRNCLRDLFVDSAFNVLFGVFDSVSVASISEKLASAFTLKVEYVFGANSVALASVNGMLSLKVDGFTGFISLIAEALSVTEAFLLAIELLELEVT
jgi:hypothetical protein